jgi:predicted O-methyltransferase YrrM
MKIRSYISQVISLFMKVKKEFPYRHYRTIEGFLQDDDASCLYGTASKLKKGSIILEIGSWKGKSTYCLARGLKEGRVIALDPFDASGESGSREIYAENRGGDLRSQFVERMKALKVDSIVETWEGMSSDFADRQLSIDFLFIDGDHSIEGCRADYENYSPKITLGGFLAFHDYQPNRKDLGPTWVIENLVTPSGQFEFVEQSGSIWLGRRKVS